MTISEKDALSMVDKDMFLEKNRLASFGSWPFETGSCTKETMAKAGFYHCGHPDDLDGVRCFCCFKELNSWSMADDPWLEHRNHSQDCLFAQIGKEEDELNLEELLKLLEETAVNRLRKYLHSLKTQEARFVATKMYLN